LSLSRFLRRCPGICWVSTPEGLVSAASLPQYLSAVSQPYPDWSRVPDSQSDGPSPGTGVRPHLGCRGGNPPSTRRPASDRCQTYYGIRTSEACPNSPARCRSRSFLFVFGSRASKVVALQESDIAVTDDVVTARLVHRKGRRSQDPLALSYERALGTVNLLTLKLASK
jgi:hypothetical protein